jgi:hypothetical protein
VGCTLNDDIFGCPLTSEMVFGYAACISARCQEWPHPLFNTASISYRSRPNLVGSDIREGDIAREYAIDLCQRSLQSAQKKHQDSISLALFPLYSVSLLDMLMPNRECAHCQQSWHPLTTPGVNRTPVKSHRLRE